MSRGVSVEALFEADLRFELQDVQALRKAIAHCAKVMDFTTRHKLEDMVKDSEEHVDWFETQLRTMEHLWKLQRSNQSGQEDAIRALPAESYH